MTVVASSRGTPRFDLVRGLDWRHASIHTGYRVLRVRKKFRDSEV